jgi:hypothetical protein
MKRKTLITIILITVGVLALAGGGILIFKDFLFPKDPAPETIDFSALTIDMEGKYYLGNESFDGEGNAVASVAVSSLSPELSETAVIESLTPSIASIDGANITVLSTGELQLNITDGGVTEQKNLTVVNAVNVFNDGQMVNALGLMKGVVLHSDITLIDIKGEPYNVGSNKYGVYGNMYGNGHVIDCAAVIGDDNKPYFDPAFKLRVSGVTIQDIYFTGYKLSEGESVNIGDLGDKGVLFDIEGNLEFVNPTATVRNCIFENANRLMNFISATVTVEDCILRNAGEACIAVGTYETGGSNITIKDVAMGLSGSAAVMIYSDGEVSGLENKAVINLEGDVDIYNWKEISTIQLIPSYELLNYLNQSIREELNKEEGEFIGYNSEDKKCIHMGILVLTGGDGYPEINGADTLGLKKRSIPLPTAAKMFLTTCDYYGYYGDNPRIAP